MKRGYETLLAQYLEYFPCVAILGPRQCGKTTLVSRLGAPWSMYDLEKTADLAQIQGNPDLFLRLNPNHVVMDEAQLEPAVFPALRVAIDSDRSTKGRFVITGSSSPELLHSVTETLAGRVGLIEMAPLAFSEIYGGGERLLSILSGEPLPEDVWVGEANASIGKAHEFWWRGGYPEPWLEAPSGFQQAWMDNYVATYLHRDIRRLFPRIDGVRFRRFLSMLASLSGQIINYSEVGRALDVSQPTAKDYFEIAHHTFVWRTIPSFERDAKKRLVKHPKGHLRDSGLLNYLLRLPDQDGLRSHPLVGRLWEAFVTEEVLRLLSMNGIACDISHYRTSAGAEVDLVLEGSFGLVPIEIKHTQTVPSRSLKSIKDFVDEFACQVGIVISNDDRPRRFTEKIVGLPFNWL